jgi:hypothetical protein
MIFVSGGEVSATESGSTIVPILPYDPVAEQTTTAVAMPGTAKFESIDVCP